MADKGLEEIPEGMLASPQPEPLPENSKSGCDYARMTVIID